MRYLFIFALNLFVCFTGFSQGSQTVKLVFVSSANTYKNFEAVIDDVSYYSENSSSYNNQNNTQTNNNKRNTIWLNNLQPGSHIIEVYGLKDGSNEERANNQPVYSSTFTVRNGFDTKIAIRNNGQAQFSERQSGFNNSVDNDVKKDNGIYSNENNNAMNSNAGAGKMNREENNNQVNSEEVDNNSVDNNSQNNSEIYKNGTTNGTVRRSTKRTGNSSPADADTSPSPNDNNNSIRPENDGSSAGKGNINNHDASDSQAETGNNNKSNNAANSKAAMSDYQFNYLYETISNQWLPGQKMKTITNEFLNSGNNFTTHQAKKLIELVTEEGNRLQLAKSSYHCITDQEHFSQVYTLFRNQATKDDLDKFLDNYHE